MKSLIIHAVTLAKAQLQLDSFLKTNPEIIKMSQCASYDPLHKEVDFVLTIIYREHK